MDRGETALLLVDLQERLLAVQPQQEKILDRVQRLVEGAASLGMLVVATEQVPEKLGPTVNPLAERLPTPFPKSCFSAAACEGVIEALHASSIRHVVLAGIETHVCIAQTALDLVALGFEPKIVVDGVGSRFEEDHTTALRRLEASGAQLTTAEGALLEWCATADDPAFRQISALVKQPRR